MQILIMSIIYVWYIRYSTVLLFFHVKSTDIDSTKWSEKKWNLFDIQAYYDNFSDISHISDFQLVLDALQEIYLHVKKK